MSRITPSKGVAVITGAAQGIGHEIALRLASDGFDIAANDIPSNNARLESLAKEIEDMSRRVILVTGDVSGEGDVKEMIDTVVRELGSLDVMVANAGIAVIGPIAKTTVEEWDRAFAVNVRGTFLCYKYAAEAMIKLGRGGRIVGACSIAGKQGLPYQSRNAAFGQNLNVKGYPDSACYCSSKFAIRGLTQSAAQEYGKHGITVNTYAPGAIETSFLEKFDDYNAQQSGLAKGEWTESLKLGTAVGSNGTPNDVASLVSFLVSKDAHFITGQSILVDGGSLFD